MTYWLILSYMATYISKFLKLPIATGFSLTAITLCAYMVSLPFAGYLADRFGRKPIMILGSGGTLLLSYPMFRILAQADSYLEMASVVTILAIVFSFFQGSNTVAMSELFPAKVRVSGFSVPYQIAGAAFGGTAMLVATWLIKSTGNVMSVPIYMTAMMAVTFLTVVFLYPKTKDKSYD